MTVIRPTEMVEFHRLRLHAVKSRNAMVRRQHKTVLLIEPVFGGWGIFRGA